MRYKVVDTVSGEVILSTRWRTAARAELRRREDAGLADRTELVRRRSVGIGSPGPHDSPVRRLMTRSRGGRYRSFTSLAQAQAAPVAAVIIEGEYGGQIYATCPASMVRCSEDRLRGLATCLEAIIQNWKDSDTASVYFEALGPGDGVWGGAGGGLVVDGVWTHDELRELGIDTAVEEILLGAREDLPDPDPPVPDDVRIGILRAYDERIPVFCRAFRFPVPDSSRAMSADELLRCRSEVVPPPAHAPCWSESTIRAVARSSGRVVEYE